MAIPLAAAVAAGQAVIGLGQTIGGAIGKKKSRNRLNKLLEEREEFQTPQEYIDAANMAANRGGFAPDMLAYLTGNADRALSSAVGSVNQLGGDPNDISAIFQQRMDESFKINSANAAEEMKNFALVLQTVNTLGENKAAEWQSRENILKDKIAAEVGTGTDQGKMMAAGLNTVVSAGATYAASQLYNEDGTPKKKKLGKGVGGQKINFTNDDGFIAAPSLIG